MLFDGYRAFAARPAAFFAAAGDPASRRPASVTVAGGGWIASGPPGADRLPVPDLPGRALAGWRTEGAGEVQTPLRGPGTAALAGRRPRLVPAREGRRARASTSNELHPLAGDRLTGAWPTYRGEGKAFG